MNPLNNSNCDLKFSLIVATKNRVAELKAFLESLSVQTYNNFEVVIVDQNDDERLGGLIAQFQKQLKILHIRSEPGLSKARNRGLKVVSGDVLAFPDDDCLYPSGLLDLLNRLFIRHPSYDGITGSLTEAVDLPIREKVEVVDKKNIWRTVKSATVFLRQEVVAETGLFDENLGIGSPVGLGAGEETDYLLRVISNGFSVVQITKARIIHPPIIKDYNEWRKVFNYTKGSSYVLRKHKFPTYIFLYQIARPFIGIIFYGLFLKGARIKYYYYSLKGKVTGYFYSINR